MTPIHFGRKDTEKELIESEASLRTIFNSANDAIFVHDMDSGQILEVNEKFFELYEYAPGEIAGLDVESLSAGTPGYTNTEALQLLKRAAGGKPQFFEWIAKSKTGKLFWVEVTLRRVVLKGKDRILAIVRDITERKQGEKALQDALREMERKVRERTRELAKTNEDLRVEITERRRAAEVIRKSQLLSDALNNLGRVIHSTLDIDIVMRRVVKEAAEALKVDATLIGLFEDDIFHVRYVHNLPGEFSRRKLTRNEVRAYYYTAEAQDAVAFNDAPNDERLNIPFVREMGVRSLLVAPLTIKNRISGAVAFYSFSNSVLFEEEHIDFSRKLAASISLALENAGLYQDLKESERRLKAILNSIPDMAWLKDRESKFILVNESYAAACGKNGDDLIGKTDFDAWPAELAEKYRTDDQEVIKSSVPKRIEEPIVPLDGVARWIEAIKTPIHNEQGEIIGTAGIARDITDRKRMEEEIRHIAQHDLLTGLPNRRLFTDLLKVEIAQARRHKSKLAILFLDLDRFKEVNDTLGHDAGDRLLKQVADRLRKTIRESDMVARIGGDEFNMVLADIARSEDASDIARKVVNALRKPVILDGHELHITTSVGISIYPDDSNELESLLRYADIAMYHAKEKGRNTFRFYNPSINVRSIERMKLESYLRQTIKRRELSVLYQPQIDIKSKKICYAEALVRWNHPDRGVLLPKEFIPLAEETGFITAIDEWVLKTVCTQAKEWNDNGIDSVCVTVNLSARQFQSPELAEKVSSVLKETGLQPCCLDIEVTESVAMSDVERTASQLRDLRAMGVHISIDDFGTGYSSLNYLKKLPIERLKIDKSFIRDIARDPDDRAIISAVTSMAHQMGIKTVAEGVETEEQLEFVRAAGCDEIQGFLFSRPVPPERFKELVATER